MTERKFQSGWKISAKSREFVLDFGKRTRMGQAEAADYLLSFLADNPELVIPPTEYAARIVQNGTGTAFTLKCQESGCGEVFDPGAHGDTVEALAKWTDKHKHAASA